MDDEPGQVLDIDTLRLALAEARKRASDGDALFANASVGLLVTVDRKIVRYNPAFAAMFGFVGNAAVGLPARVLYPSDAAYDDVGRIAGPALRTGKPIQLDLQMRHQNGSSLWISLVGYLRDLSDPGRGTFWVLENRTNYRATEQALSVSQLSSQASESRLRRILEVMPDGLIIVDAHGTIETLNQSAEQIFGYPSNELVGHPIEILIPGHFRSSHVALRKGYQEGPSRKAMGDRRDLTGLHKDGHEVSLEVGLAPLFEGEQTRIIASVTDVSGQREVSRTLDAAFKVARLGFFRWDTVNDMLTLDPNQAGCLGVGGDILQESIPLSFLIDPAFVPKMRAAGADLLSGGPAIDLELRARNGTGAFGWIHIHGARQSPGSPIVLVVFSDISAQKEAEVQNAKLTQRLEIILKSLPDMILSIDTSGQLIELRQALHDSLKADAGDWHGRPYSDILQESISRHMDELVAKAFESSLPQEGQCSYSDASGSQRHVTIGVTRLVDGRQFPTGFLAVLRDETERIAALEALSHAAFHDPLTGLPNRRMLQDRLAQARARSQRENKVGALLLIDLDKFKALNDTYGHDAGDRLLQEVASRMRTAVRAQDTVARLGGDEFAILLEGFDHEKIQQQIEVVMGKLRAAFAQPCDLGTVQYSILASIGYSEFRGETPDNEMVFREADKSMYANKANRRRE